MPSDHLLEFGGTFSARAADDTREVLAVRQVVSCCGLCNKYDSFARHLIHLVCFSRLDPHSFCSLSYVPGQYSTANPLLHEFMYLRRRTHIIRQWSTCFPLVDYLTLLVLNIFSESYSILTTKLIGSSSLLVKTKIWHPAAITLPIPTFPSIETCCRIQNLIKTQFMPIISFNRQRLLLPQKWESK